MERIWLDVREPYHEDNGGVANAQVRTHRLTVRDRVLMVMIWMRTYPSHSQLASMFHICPATVNREIHHILPILHTHYVAREVVWHDLHTWTSFIGRDNEFPNVVALLDGTVLKINTPSGPAQRLYYRRDKGCHLINWLVIADLDGYFVFGQSGFLGHTSDAGCYNMLPLGQLQLPPAALIMADRGFPQRHPTIVPIRRDQNILPQHLKNKFNSELRRRRVYIEHYIRELKIYQVVGSRRIRMRRALLPIVCNVVMALCNRRKRRIRQMRGDYLRRIL